MSNRIFQLIILTFTLTAFSMTQFMVSGNVYLEDALESEGSHAGVTISFTNLISNVEVASGESNEDGSYNILVNPGWYVIDYTKDGYVPWEIGDVTLAEDMEIEDVTLVPGSVLEVSGDVSGNWTTSYQYWVTDNITVPEGETLTIDAGVRVKFYEGTGLVANGTLEVNGTEEAGVLFTSKSPTPLPSDWDNVELYGENNIISYLEYEWADDGFTGDGANNSTFDHLYIGGTLPVEANGIYLTGSTDMTFTNNNILTSGDYGIFSESSSNSVVNNNQLNSSYDQAAIAMRWCDNCIFDGNLIENRPYRGIWAQYSNNASITNNTIDVQYNGIEAQDGSNLTIQNNTITNFEEHGIYFQCSENSTISANQVTSHPDDGDTKHGIFNSCDEEGLHHIFDNYVNIYQSDSYGCCGSTKDMIGIHIRDAEVYDNTLEIFNDYNSCCHQDYTVGIYANRSTIYNNTLNVFDDGRETGYAIESYGDSNNRNSIYDNNIIARSNTVGIAASYATITNNNISGESNGQWAFINGDQDSLMYNTVTGMHHGISADNQWDNYIAENTVESNHWGIYSNDAHGEHTYLNNTLTMNSGDWLVYVTNTDNVIIENNTFIGDGGSGFYINNTGADINRNLLVTPGRGVEFRNQAGSVLSQNTIIGSNGDYGVHISELSAPSVYSNIIQGFQTGIYADNDLFNTDLQNNNLWMISGNDFEGSALPPIIGAYVSENVNGDSSDIYGNITMDPIFTNEYAGDYTLAAISPCINAGNTSVVDPDGTIGDIGAFYHHIYMVLEHGGMPNTIDTEGPYAVNATAYATAGGDVDVSLFYTTNGGGSFTELVMNNTGGDNFAADIPGQELDTRVEYYFVASDGENTLEDPYGAPDNMHYFDVTLVAVPSDLSATSNNDGSIDLTWTPPVLSFGELINQQLFRTDSEGGVTSGDFYANLALDDFTFSDEDTEEGATYSYRLMGSIDIDGEVQTLFISEEVSILSDDATIVFADGFVILEDTGDYGDVMVEFERISPTPTVYDTVYTDIDGYYEHTPGVGIYNINYFKYGWQPGQVPNIYLTENTEVEDVVLGQGYSVYIEGAVSGDWTPENIYFVTDNIVVNEGDTLTIHPGVEVIFTGNYNISTFPQVEEYIYCWDFNEEECSNYSFCGWEQYYDSGYCYGDGYYTSAGSVLIADGDEDNRILFTSGQPIQSSGDWDGITLHGPGHVLRYVDYEYANRKIEGYDVDNLVFEHSTISNLPLNANGLYLNNDCDNIKINHNTFDVDGDYAVHAHYSSNSEFNYNTSLSLPYDVFELLNSDNSQFIGNIITDFEETGLDCNCCNNFEVTENHVTITDNGDWKAGLYNDCNTSGSGYKNNTVYNNTVTTSDSMNNQRLRAYGIMFDDSKIYNNDINIDLTDAYNANNSSDSHCCGIHTRRSEVYDNEITVIDLHTRYTDPAIYSGGGNSDNRNQVYSNTITAVHASRGIWADYADIYDNYLTTGEEVDHANWAIGHGGYNHIYNNQIIGGFNDGIQASDTWDNVIEDNYMEIQHHGIHANSAYGTHVYQNNVIKRLTNYGNHASDGAWFIYTTNNMDSLTIVNNDMQGESGSGVHIHDSNNGVVLDMHDNIIKAEYHGAYFHKVDMDVHHNLFNLRSTWSADRDGIRFHTENDGDFYNNTVVAQIDSVDDKYRYGIEAINYSNPTIVNNIVMGFDIGIKADSELSMVANNNIWGNDLNYSGDGLPALFGDINTVNLNGDPSDVYANISMNPSFVLQDEDNFNLQVISPCINAGQSAYTDPDGTISDIGAFYRDINDTEDVFGCIDEEACNFNEFANQDNGSCSYAETWYADQDGDGLGSPSVTVDSCDQPNGFVGNSNDSEPDCASNDTDECGICGGGNLNQDCHGECFGMAFVDDCGVCSEGNSGHAENSDQDCNGDCFGEAYLDGCSLCVGGDTGEEPCPQDCNGVFDGDAFWDDCGICSGGDTDHEANAEMDCNGICYGPSVYDNFEGCCSEDQIDECGKCDGNGWDYCDYDDDGLGNYEQWGYGVYDIDISDIPDDQGGFVAMSFHKSFYDTDSLRTIEVYTIERWDDTHWTSLHTISGYASDYYHTEVRTAQDSTATDDGLTLFRVIANMDEGNFQNTEEAWGYSIDNIAPATPDDLAGDFNEGNVTLNWSGSNDEDFSYFNIYRDSDVYATTVESDFVDIDIPNVSELDYQVSAIDANGNESILSELLTIFICQYADLNSDTNIDVLDIIVMVNCIIDGDCTGCSDLNGDSNSDILDIVQLVHIILDN